MYAEMAKDDDMDVTVWYCSRQGVEHTFDRQFNANVRWNIPILEGYRHVFLKNYALRPSSNGFWGLQNWGLIGRLWKAPKSALVINGWQFLIFVVAVFFGKIFGHTICFRIDTPLHQEKKRTPRSLWLRKLLLGNILFRFVDYFLYIGRQNKDFYKYYGIPERKLIFSPFSVDNQRFRAALPENDEEKKRIRRTLNLPENDIIILFSGKYLALKRPFDLLRAFQQSAMQNCTLVMMGEGELRLVMEDFIKNNRLDNVLLTGFINQAEIARYYAAADIFVLSSDSETWGLSVNEAMNLALPLILSDAIGCAADLLEQGANGFIYPTGDINALAEKLRILVNDKQLRDAAGQKSLQIIGRHSYEAVIQNLKNLPIP